MLLTGKAEAIWAHLMETLISHMTTSKRPMRLSRSRGLLTGKQTSDTFGMMTGARRPAGFLDYVRTTASLNARLTNSSAGLCAQGASAGSGALGYSLAWYKDSARCFCLSTDLDNVELLSGPVFSNVKFGCQFPPPPSGYNVVCHTGQFGCSPGTTTWSSGLQYVGAALTGIRSWTGDVTSDETEAQLQVHRTRTGWR